MAPAKPEASPEGGNREGGNREGGNPGGNRETRDSFLFRAGCGCLRLLLAGTPRRARPQPPSRSLLQVFDELLVAPGPAWHGGHSRGCASGCPTRREKITRNLLITSGLLEIEFVSFYSLFVERDACRQVPPS